jgi:RimJ/RimL family protein N-acetyltransferase
MADRFPAAMGEARICMIEGRKIVLGPVETQDSELLFAWINDPQIVLLHGPYRPIDAETHRRWMERLSEDSSTVVFAIREAAERRLVGLVQLVGIHSVHRSAELRIRIGDPGDRGKGLGSEAVDLCCRFAFGDLGLNRVFLNVFADNAPAIAAYERAGFAYEGTQKKAAFIGGEWKDVVAMGRLAGAGSADFTEDAFTALLRSLIDGGYRFAGYGEQSQDRHVIWRHDVDVSMHRAARLAGIEAGLGVKATYFLNPRSPFYNLLEPEIAARTAAIVAAGHDIGLHFDAGAFGVSRWSRAQLEETVAAERKLLETIVGREIRCVSWHNPDLSNLLADFQDETVAGLYNAYSQRLRETYAYCSDSNGYWRFKPMAEVIAEAPDRLHLLTHPEWWTPRAMSPSQRIDRAILGRARGVRQFYDGTLAAAGRKQPD